MRADDPGGTDEANPHMANGAVTFDFHNTLARCDRWFDLEVRHLVSSFLRWHAEDRGQPPPEADLLATADTAYRRLRDAIKDHGDELPAETCVTRILEEIALPVDAPTIARGVEHLMLDTLSEVHPLPGAVATIRALAAAAVPLGIVSSAVYHPFLEWTLDRFALHDAFAVVTTSASARYYKCRPELYWRATTALDAPPERSVHVGDSFRFDVEGARRAGMRTVWLRPASTPAPNGGPPADLTIGSLEGAAPRILDLLDRRPA